MMAADPSQLLQLYEKYRTRKRTADNNVQEMLEYMFPRKAFVTTRHYTEGYRNTQKQYDGTAEASGKKLAASLHAGLTSSSQKWFSLVPRATELRHNKEVMDWAEECSDILYAAFNQSNFAQEISECYLDLVFIGTSAVVVEEDGPSAPGRFSGLRFTSVNFGDYAYDENAKGYVDRFFRRFYLSAAAIVDRFKDTVPETIKTKAVGAPQENVEVLHAIYPRAVRDARRYNSTNMAFASCYVLFQPATLLAEGGFHEFPVAVARWAKSSGEIYGRGPGHTAYPDVRTLTRVTEVTLEAASKAIDPPLLALHESVYGELSLDPTSINVVTEKGAVEALDTHARFDVSKLTKDDLKQAIREAFFIDQLQLQEGPQMTATEVVARQEQLQRMVGPTLGRIHSEKIRPIVERSFALMYRAQALPPAPAILQQQGGDIDVIAEGPLARAQRASDLLAIQRKNAWVQQQVEVGNQSVLDLYDSDEEGREVAAMTGVPSNILRDPAQVDKIRQDRAKQMKANAALEKLAAIGKTAGSAAPALKAASDPNAQQALRQMAGAA